MNLFQDTRRGRRRCLCSDRIRAGHALRARSFQGRSITVDRQTELRPRGFNDRALSVIVRGGWWQACQDARFEGQCVTLRPGSYANLTAMGLNRPDLVGASHRGPELRLGADV